MDEATNCLGDVMSLRSGSSTRCRCRSMPVGMRVREPFLFAGPSISATRDCGGGDSGGASFLLCDSLIISGLAVAALAWVRPIASMEL